MPRRTQLGALLLASCAAHPTRAPEDALIDRHVADLRTIVAGPKDQANAQVLLLGVFHFADAGMDAHKPKYVFDVSSESGRQQIAEVLARLLAFAPTKVLVEYDSKDQDKLDAWYARFLAGSHKPTANEIVTLGFALAKELRHQRVYGCDADGERIVTAPKTAEEFIEAGKRMGKEWAFKDPVLERYEQMSTQRDEIEQTLTLRQRLRLLNNQELLRLSHGAYFFFEAFRVSNGTDFLGPDSFASMWHNRNLRIFSNIQRLADAPSDRVLVIIGAGHIPIVEQCVRSCPTMTWIPVDDYFGAAPPEP
ncbi:MAG TPA: DUF5694 domain-containing protein [Planctomycetota bacterium]|nr:DUF5694 domain-containing protein [Planctomycetota bacterium]